MKTQIRPGTTRLNDAEFLAVIANTPLVSIDLVITKPNGAILLGRRVNEPAKGKWFVPGGRIYKDESLESAFERICLAEIGERRVLAEATLLGPFTHRYETNAFSVPGITTHYVVLAYQLSASDAMNDATAQHSGMRWFLPSEADPALGAGYDPDVHEYVLPYFRALSRQRVEDSSGVGRIS